MGARPIAIGARPRMQRASHTGLLGVPSRHTVLAPERLRDSRNRPYLTAATLSSRAQTARVCRASTARVPEAGRAFVPGPMGADRSSLLGRRTDLGPAVADHALPVRMSNNFLTA